MGYLATGIADLNYLPVWLTLTNPDVVMDKLLRFNFVKYNLKRNADGVWIVLHLGTNDIVWNRPTDQIITAFSKLVDQTRENNPYMDILVRFSLPSNCVH